MMDWTQLLFWWHGNGYESSNEVIGQNVGQKHFQSISQFEKPKQKSDFHTCGLKKDFNFQFVLRFKNLFKLNDSFFKVKIGGFIIRMSHTKMSHNDEISWTVWNSVQWNKNLHIIDWKETSFTMNFTFEPVFIWKITVISTHTPKIGQKWSASFSYQFDL